jgi:hypothetical protein
MDDGEASALAPSSRAGECVSLNMRPNFKKTPFGRCGLSAAFAEYAGGDPQPPSERAAVATLSPTWCYARGYSSIVCGFR